jgi:hypothetical protein
MFLVACAGDMRAQDAIRVIDDFESIAAWEARPSDGVTVRLSRDRGVKGGALRVDFDFHGGGGYAVIRRDVDLTLAENYEFRWSMRAIAPRNNLEFKLADASGDNVWWSNQRDYEFPRAWTTVVRKKRHISFAWGPSGGGELARPRAIELAITAGSGGKGTIWLDEMIVATLPAPTTTLPVPVARASMVVGGSSAANVLDGDSTTSWRGAPGASLTIDLRQQREFGGMAIAWDSSRIARSAVVSSSRDGTSWK